MRAQLNNEISKLLSVLCYIMSLPELYLISIESVFLVHIFESIFNLSFKVFPITYISSIGMCGTVLMPPGQSIFFIM